MNTLYKGTSRNIKILLIACALLTSAMILSCGRLPPEKLWTGDSDDTIGVKQVVVDYNTGNWNDFLSRLDFDTIIDTLRFSKIRIFPNEEVRSLEFRIKQAYWPSCLQIKLTSRETDTSINFVYDTTATVELITSINGIARVGCDSVQRYSKDTVIPLNQVTVWKDEMTNFPTDWTTGGTGGPWTRFEDSARSYSKPYSVKCTPNANYDNNQNNWMQRSIDLSNYELPSVNFSIWQSTASNDSIYFEYYDTIWNVSWSASGTDTTFNTVTADIPKTATTIRFRFYSDGGGTAEGVYIDDVLLTAANSTDTLMLFSGWAAKSFLHDSIIRGDTVLVYDTLTPGRDSIVLTKEFEGQIWRSLYFGPKRTGNTDTSPIASPRVWELKKISGGVTVRIPDSEDDAPYNYFTIVKQKGMIENDTLYDRPDTLHFGIHRLYSFPNGVWSFPPDTLLEIFNLYPILNPQDTVFYFAYGDRYYTPTGLGSDARIHLGSGVYPNNLNYFSVMLCARQGLIYKNSPFKLRVWQMPVRIE